jgi:phosphoribosyl-ATP pyrophosphohydrolase/phosphoribosyl-AMP cyclohydrolase/histidinol dehydrogenase
VVAVEFTMLRRAAPSEIGGLRRNPVDPKARAVAEPIVEAIRKEGELALRQYAEKFGELEEGGKLLLTRDVELKAAYDAISVDEREMLERTAARIRTFALAQRNAVAEVTIPIPGGEAGHTVEPVEAAGCYAPGGRYPLPSTVLMTACTARVAGCKRVVVASPRPSATTLAAAYVAEADYLMPIGGAHAIAALAHGAGEALEPCDAVVGPGNMYVTAAKSLVAGSVAIDMLAGPSEVLVIADEHADAAVVAADLLAQAEHDPSAASYLVCTSEALADAVDKELAAQLDALSTKEIAAQAMKNGCAVVVGSLDEAAAISDRLAPEHLELHVADSMGLKKKLKHYGGLFCGQGAAEVLGDYGAGPNHTLPTGGTARSTGGLCALTFLRVRTWMRVDDLAAAKTMVEDAAMLGDLEGLAGHAAAARFRLR